VCVCVRLCVCVRVCVCACARVNAFVVVCKDKAQMGKTIEIPDKLAAK